MGKNDRGNGKSRCSVAELRPMNTENRVCSDCHQELPCSAFYPRFERSGHVRSYCKPCANIRARDYRRTNPDSGRRAAKKWYQNGGSNKIRENRLLKKYGISLRQFEEIEKAQNGKCAICGMVPTSTRLHVDHCHKTGKVRGLLCVVCNRGIGQFSESVELLHSAARYLEKQMNQAEARENAQRWYRVAVGG